MRTFSCPLIILSLDIFNTLVAIKNTFISSSFSTVEAFGTLFIHSINIHCRINCVIAVANFPLHVYFEVSPEYSAFMDSAETF